MKTKINKYIHTIYLGLGEIVVAILTVLGFMLVGRFEWTVITGAILGGIVTIANLLILSISVDRAINKYMDMRGDKEMTEEEAEEFSKAHNLEVQNAITKSYILRTALMLGSLVVALLTGWFNVIATAIPLLMYKPLLYATDFLKKKRGE